MAYSNECPEVCLEHGGVVVFHMYKYDDQPPEDHEDWDDWDNHELTYHFQVDGEHFDVRTIPAEYWPDSGEDYESCRTAMRQAIDAGVDLATLRYPPLVK